MGLFPEHVTLVLQQLSYLALIIICPCTVYATIKAIIIDINLNNHLDADKLFHGETSEHIGKHYSQIHDLQMDVAHIQAITTGRNGNGKK